MNNFKELEPTDNLPIHIKEEVMGNLGSIRMIMDMVDLFLVKGLFSLAQSVAPNGEQHPTTQEPNRPNGERNSD